jgi:hypothetical protein
MNNTQQMIFQKLAEIYEDCDCFLTQEERKDFLERIEKFYDSIKQKYLNSGMVFVENDFK